MAVRTVVVVSEAGKLREGGAKEVSRLADGVASQQSNTACHCITGGQILGCCE